MHESECRAAKCEYITKDGWCSDCNTVVQNVFCCGIIDDYWVEQDKKEKEK